MTQKIVVLGAGFAGIKAVRTLSKALKTDAEITLIDRHSYHTMMTQLHEVAGGRVPHTNATYDLAKLLGHKKNVKLVTAEINTVDKAAKVVKTDAGDYSYDYLIAAIGAETADFGVKGVKEHSFTLWSLEDAMKIKAHLDNIMMQASTELDLEKRKAMLNFSVAGSGFSGIEMMGELIEWRDVAAKAWKIDPKDVTLNVVEMMPTILNALDRKQADKAMAYMKRHGVTFLLNHGITEVAADHINVNVGGRDEEKVAKTIPTYTLIWTTGVQGNTDASSYGIPETQRGHRLQANEYMEAIGDENKNIYVAGDLQGYIAEEGGRPLPQIVEAAEQTGHVAADNIIAAIKGGEKKKIDFKFSGTMVSVGGRWGVAALGDTIKDPKKNPVRLTGFWAMFMKNFIDIIYTLQIGSLWYCFTFLKNEFFHTRHDRNLFHGHFSRLGNVLWSFPLRLFYGFMWLQDALPKVFGGANIGGIFGHSADSWMGSTLKISTFLKSQGGWIPDPATTDAAAGASTHEAASTITNAEAAKQLGLTNLHSNAFHYEFGTIPAPTTDGVPKWLQPMMKIFAPNYDMAVFLQKLMSVVELGLAILIIVGAFTWIAAGATAVLTVMFASTGMLTYATLWYIPVAIALMNGSGRALGLDKWIQPWFQKVFFKAWYAKSSSIYPVEK